MMNYDDIFGDDIFKENATISETYFDDLEEIFNKNGFDEQLTMLCLKCCDLTALNVIYRQLKEREEKIDCEGKMFDTMGTIVTIIESFIVNNSDVIDSLEKAKEKYIDSELDKDNYKSDLVKNNRIAYLFKKKKK